jgi:hypothetical protein
MPSATTPATIISVMASPSDPVEPERVDHHQREQHAAADEVDEVAHVPLLALGA